MDKRLRILMLGLVLILGLAACGNEKKDDSPNKGANSDKGAETITDEPEVDEEESEKETDSKLKHGETIGVTMDEFKNRFNENAAKQGLEYKIGDFEWQENIDGTQTTTIELHEDLHISGLLKGDEEELKAVLLEVEGFESRQTSFDLVQVIIESVDKDMTAKEAKGIMENLGLKDPNVDGDDSEQYTDRNGFKYLLMNETSNWLEFGIANENDPDLDLN